MTAAAKKPLAVGDREWRPIEGWSYEVSSDGEVRNSSGKVLKGGWRSRGEYRAVSLVRWVDGKREQVNIAIHHLVMRWFIGPRPPGHVINHKNGIKTDNRLENLEYCTPRDNREHAKAMRLYQSGARCSWSKLNEEDVLLIRRVREAGLSYLRIARAFGVSKKAITQIFAGKNWKHTNESVREVLGKRGGSRG